MLPNTFAADVDIAMHLGLLLGSGTGTDFVMMVVVNEVEGSAGGGFVKSGKVVTVTMNVSEASSVSISSGTGTTVSVSSTLGATGSVDRLLNLESE